MPEETSPIDTATDESAAYYARQHALSCAHNPNDPPEEVVRRAEAYADFILND